MSNPTFSELPSSASGRPGWVWQERRSAVPATMVNGKPWPRITVVTPSYNHGCYIEETIRSVLLQGYPNLEYIVIDGESIDETVDILAKYNPWIDFWSSEKDRGQSHAINKGMEWATGSILGWLNSDDQLLPNALFTIADLSVEDPLAVAWVGGCYRFDLDRTVLDTVIPKCVDHKSIADWGNTGFFYQPSCFFSAAAWHVAGHLDEQLHYAMDLDLWLRLSRIGHFVPTVEVLSAALIHDDAKSRADREKMQVETLAVQLRHGFRDIAAQRLQRLIYKESPVYRLKQTMMERIKMAIPGRRRSRTIDALIPATNWAMVRSTE